MTAGPSFPRRLAGKPDRSSFRVAAIDRNRMFFVSQPLTPIRVADSERRAKATHA
jgi:hypothetical protein